MLKIKFCVFGIMQCVYTLKHIIFHTLYIIVAPLLGVGIFSHLTIRSDSDSVSHDPIQNDS